MDKFRVMALSIFLILIVLVPISVVNSETEFRFIWPLKSEKISSKLSSLFGESRMDHFHNGVDLVSVNEEVRSIADGKIVFSRYSEDSPFDSEYGTGNCVWISHPKGIMSAYYHLKEARVDFSKSGNLVKQGEVVGYTGNTGHSSGAHLHFVVASDNGAKLINPLLILPEIEDHTIPEIGGLTLSVGENYTNINDGDNINVSKNFPLTVTIFDKGEKSGQRRGVQYIGFKFNGVKIKESKFNEISLKNGKWTNDDHLSFDDLFFNGNYYVGDLALKSGENTIEVNVSDFHGNKNTKSFSFYVNRITGR